LTVGPMHLSKSLENVMFVSV